MTRMPIHESRMPSAQPKRLSISDSIRNCSMIVFRLAPMALRMPISRVLSETDTSMMFMMPIPPTSSEIAAMPPSSRESVLMTVFMVSATCDMLKSVYALSSLSKRASR